MENEKQDQPQETTTTTPQPDLRPLCSWCHKPITGAVVKMLVWINGERHYEDFCCTAHGGYRQMSAEG